MSGPLSAGQSEPRSPQPPVSQPEASRSLDTAERLHRWALLIASGEAPLPAELAPAELSVVLAEVARLRRERLVRFVARAIAQDIYCEREP